MSASKPLPLCEVSSKTPCFVGPYAPTLNLVQDPDCDHAVYILRCWQQITGGSFCYYVGRVPRSRLAVRMKEHVAEHWDC